MALAGPQRSRTIHTTAGDNHEIVSESRTRLRRHGARLQRARRGLPARREGSREKGTGARKMAFLTVYYATLFLPARAEGRRSRRIIDADAPMSIVMKIDSALVKKGSFVSAGKGRFREGGRGRVQDRERAAVPRALQHAHHREGRRVLPETTSPNRALPWCTNPRRAVRPPRSVPSRRPIAKRPFSPCL